MSWYRESWRHSLAAKGINTAQPKYAKGLKMDGVIAEPKYDGTRMLLYKRGDSLEFINRRGVRKNETYPEMAEVRNNIIGDVVLDGEIVAVDAKHPYGNFETLSRRDRLKDKTEIEARSKTMPLKFIAFDILEKDGKKLMDKPLLERKEILDKVIRQSDRIKEIEYTNRPDDLLKKIKKLKGEGIVMKDVNSKYQQGSTRTWEKLKLSKENDVAIVGATAGTGKRKGFFGALKMAVNSPKGFVEVGNVGTGFTDKDLDEITKRLAKGEKLVARVEYRKVGSRGNYIEPRFIGLREDITATQTHR